MALIIVGNISNLSSSVTLCLKFANIEMHKPVAIALQCQLSAQSFSFLNCLLSLTICH